MYWIMRSNQNAYWADAKLNNFTVLSGLNNPKPRIPAYLTAIIGYGPYAQRHKLSQVLVKSKHLHHDPHLLQRIAQTIKHATAEGGRAGGSPGLPELAEHRSEVVEVDDAVGHEIEAFAIPRFPCLYAKYANHSGNIENVDV